MGKPAARVGDMHECPMVDPVTGTPHGRDVIIGPGNGTVLIGGMPAATVGDACKCGAGLNTIISGSTGVFIGGKPAVRVEDMCAHGGEVIGGLASVLIGERGFSKGWIDTWQEEKEKTINVAIRECIALLEKNLDLLKRRDKITMEAFEKWFGSVNEFEVQTIIYRIENALNVAKELTLENFKVIVDEHTRMYSSAMVWSGDEFHTIYLGDLFWDKEHIKEQPQKVVLIHELSHFDYIGMTSDFDYGIKQCLDLTKTNHKKALYNADSFERFIKSRL